MNVVVATDDNFVQHCCIMLVSLLLNNKDVNVFVLTEGLKPDSVKIIKEEVIGHGGKVTFCIVDQKKVAEFPMPTDKELSHISRATYYRLLIADLLPRNIDKILYLDCDIIINGSIKELWDLDMTGYAIAAVPQIGYGYEAIRLGYPVKYGYFNAGVNLMNLGYFRDNHLSEKLLEYILSNKEKIKYHDQDTLNAVLYDKCLHIMPQWNMTSVVYDMDIFKKGDKDGDLVVNDYKKEKENIRKWKKKPIIVHYVSKPKPWQDNCIHPKYGLYYHYASKTLYYNSTRRQSPFMRGIAICKHNIREFLSNIKQSLHKSDPSRL